MTSELTTKYKGILKSSDLLYVCLPYMTITKVAISFFYAILCVWKDIIIYWLLTIFTWLFCVCVAHSVQLIFRPMFLTLILNDTEDNNIIMFFIYKIWTLFISVLSNYTLRCLQTELFIFFGASPISRTFFTCNGRKNTGAVKNCLPFSCLVSGGWFCACWLTGSLAITAAGPSLMLQ